MKNTITRTRYALLTFFVCYIIFSFIFLDLFWVCKIQKFTGEERLLLLGTFSIAQVNTQLFITIAKLM